jgi:hypothetical protein
LAGGCSGHALAQAVDLEELGDVVVDGSTNGRVKLLLVVDLATSGQAILVFIYFGLVAKVFGWQKKQMVVILAGEKIGWMW